MPRLTRSARPTSRVQIEPDRPKSLSLAIRIASASSSNGDDRDHRAEDLLAQRPVGRVGRRQHGRRVPEARALRRAAAERDRRVVGHVGRDPVALAGADQRAHLGVLVARVGDDDAADGGLEQLHEPVVDDCARPGCASARSSPGRRCRRPRTARSPRPGSRSASAKTTFALLPPSSSVTGLICAAQPAITCRPTSVEPVKTILATSGESTNRCPTTLPLPGSTWKTSGGHAGLERELGEPDRGQRGQLGRLEHDGVAGGERGRESPRRDRHREVPRHDHADDAERLVEGDVDAVGDRDLLADQPFRRAGVVGDHVADVAGLPPRVADRVPGVGDLELREVLEVGVDRVGEAAQQPGPVTRCDRAPGLERLAGPGDRGVGLLARRAGRSTPTTCSVAGLMHVVRAVIESPTSARSCGRVPSR